MSPRLSFISLNGDLLADAFSRGVTEELLDSAGAATQVCCLTMLTFIVSTAQPPFLREKTFEIGSLIRP